jgi:hypothetical protein
LFPANTLTKIMDARMNSKLLICCLAAAAALATDTLAQGPYAPTNWPPTINPSKKVHYVVTDGAFTAPNTNWNNSLGFAGGGDQATTTVTLCSPDFTFTAIRATSTFLNVFDQAFYEWNTNAQIDILVQVLGDDTVTIPPGLTNTRVWRFRQGTTGAPACPNGPGGGPTVNGAPVATNIHNFKWNWLLFQITNQPVIICATNDTGNRWVGTVPAGSAGNTNYGGVNGGTIRFAAVSPANWTGLTIHAVAFGEAGAFGSTNDINLFEPAAVACDPVPVSNLVGIDFNGGVTNFLQVMNDTDQTVTYTNSIGPSNDLRKAVIPVGQYLNFGILSNYLGKPCNPNVAIKICADFYDDPAFAGAGVQFGPGSYAVDALGCNPNMTYPSAGLYSMQGSGRWIRKSWTIGGVNLVGVNVEPLTGGPRFTSIGGQVAVSRFFMAALRTSGPLANQDPLADCLEDPAVCEGIYGDYAELDLPNGIMNGLNTGNNAGDQTYVIEQAGPPNDLRMSVRGASSPSYYLNFAILNNALGPISQGNTHLAMAVTYYDDPALAGKAFRPQTWRYQFGGGTVQGFFNPPPNPGSILLQGTGKWRDAYWEFDRISFDGINQSPAAARFEMDDPGIHISRVRYAVIRPCGTNAGVNLLGGFRVSLAAAQDTNALVRLSWPYRAPQAQLQSIATFGSAWANFAGTPTVEGGEQSVLRITNSPDSQFFRLIIPPIP